MVLMYTTTSSYKQMFKKKGGEGGWKLYLDHVALTLGRKTKKRENVEPIFKLEQLKVY